MNKILIEVNENYKELANKIRSLNCEIQEMSINHFNGDPTIISFLIGLTPTVVTKIGEIIKELIHTPSKGKVKIEGVEIEGFSYKETIELLNIVAKNNEKEMAIIDSNMKNEANE